MQAAYFAYPLRVRDSSVRRTTTKLIRRTRTLRLAGMILALVLVFFLAPRVVHTGTAAEQAVSVDYTVAYGDTLWQIASQFSPGQDQRKVITIIKGANGLRTADLMSGQVLQIPGSVLK